VFTARYALSPYIKQTRFVFKGLIEGVYRSKNEGDLFAFPFFTGPFSQQIALLLAGK
jgi:hypothetical protein